MNDEQVNDTVTTLVGEGVRASEAPDLLDVHLPAYDVACTEHLVVEADTAAVFEAAQDFDFMTTRSPVVTALMTARGLPSRLVGHPVLAPQTLMLARDPGALPGWLVLGAVPGREVAFGAVGTFWKPNIEWHDVAADHFASFEDRGGARSPVTCWCAQTAPDARS